MLNMEMIGWEGKSNRIAKEKMKNKTGKKETFMQGVVTLMFSQVLIKLLGLI